MRPCPCGAARRRRRASAPWFRWRSRQASCYSMFTADTEHIVNMIHNDDYTSKRRDALSQLFLVTTLMTSDMQRGLTERGLTMTRAHVLWVLGEAGEMTQRQLAETLKVTPRNVTALV